MIKNNNNLKDKVERHTYLKTEQEKEFITLKAEKLELQDEISNQKNVNLMFGLLNFIVLLIGSLFFVLERRKAKNKILVVNEKGKASKEIYKESAYKLSKLYQKFLSIKVNGNTKELNKYSYCLRELEKIENKIKEISSNL